MATAVLSTLEHVTFRKLERLAEQREKYEAQKKAILEEVQSQPALTDKVRTLINGYESHHLSTSGSVFSPANVGLFLTQANHDPSISSSVLGRWQKNLERELGTESLKYEYATLFGRLVTEWIKSTNASGASEDRDSFEAIGRKEMHDQRKTWESFAFTENQTDEAAIQQYLDDIFATASQKKYLSTPFKDLRERMADFDQAIARKFSAETVRLCIKGVLKEDLFAGKKRKALSDLLSQETVLNEMADVLNMDLDDLDNWRWEPSPVPVEMRRQLNGKYRVFMDEEIHQAILIHYIGIKWAVHMKTAFKAFMDSEAWSYAPQHSLSQLDKQRRAYFLGDSERHSRMASSKIHFKRQKMYKDDFFMIQLPDKEEAGGKDYDGNDSHGEERGKSMMDVKQSLLHLVTTEAHLFTKIYGHCNILQSDFKWFGPSLPHSSIYAVLRFLGVPQKWLNFFKCFLEAPLAFKQDGPNAQATTRKSGIPMSHTLSSVLGEAVLFCLDYGINVRTGGSNLYRFHDDLWFWGHDHKCVEAWTELKLFVDVMGLQLNEEKTGAVRLSEDEGSAPPAALPKGEIKWGFLNLDAKTGKWVINRTHVDEHVEELKRQLAACGSVFAWVQAFNSYVSQFFTNNFAKPANCFGRQHVHMVVETFTYIQRKLFGEAEGAGGNVTDYLRSVIKERFGVENIPDGFFYLPVELGGMELRNPFIPLFSVYGQSLNDPTQPILKAIEEEEAHYQEGKMRFDNGVVENRVAREKYQPRDSEGFMSFEEYTKAREETSRPMYTAYIELLALPDNDRVERTEMVDEALRTLLGGDWGRSGFSADWGEMDKYWQWVCELYAHNVIERFGGLSMGERELLPIGLVSMLRSERVRWQG